MYEIIICPVKMLYRYAMEGEMSDVCAIVTSSFDIDTKKLSGFHSTLCLSFHDVVDNNDYRAFNSETAKKIVDYVRNLPKNLDTLFVCCDAGQSRSAAMAAAIMRANGGDDMCIWNSPKYCPNSLVYKTLCDCFGIMLTGCELDNKQLINRQALENAINNQ